MKYIKKFNEVLELNRDISMFEISEPKITKSGVWDQRYEYTITNKENSDIIEVEFSKNTIRERFHFWSVIFSVNNSTHKGSNYTIAEYLDLIQIIVIVIKKFSQSKKPNILVFIGNNNLKNRIYKKISDKMKDIGEYQLVDTKKTKIFNYEADAIVFVNKKFIKMVNLKNYLSNFLNFEF